MESRTVTELAYTDKTVCLDSNYDAPVVHGYNNIVGLHNTTVLLSSVYIFLFNTSRYS